jgi:chloramphenicol 3-O phosphotransferase
MGEPGRIVILNGSPRSGKSSIAEVIQTDFDGVWMNLGVDVIARHVTPTHYQPGIGLRPGGERPDLEPFVMASYAALYESIASHSRLGFNVVVDVGHHDSYSRPLSILFDCARRLLGLPVIIVGVRCPIDEIMRRRGASPDGRYVAGSPDEPVPPPVLRWQSEVHIPGIYDLEVDTSLLQPGECAAEIQRFLTGPPRATALDRILALAGLEDPI